MLKRREFLKTSAIVATAASTGILTTPASAGQESKCPERRSARGAAGPLTPMHRPIHFVLVDEEFEDSVIFASTLIEHGAHVFSVQQDIGRLWFGDLGAQFRPGNSIAGLTTHTDLMVCSSFARQHGARIRFEGSHDCRGCEELTHSLRIGTDEPGISAALASAGTAWPQALASRLTGLSECSAFRDDSCRTTTRRSETHPGSLFSWVVA